jgi:hypothetical protein
MAEEASGGVAIDELFRHAGLSKCGPVRWKDEIQEFCAGVYVIAIERKIDSWPAFPKSVEGLDEGRRKIESDNWRENEVILYIGQTTKQTLAHRLHQFYIHKYGNKSPHRGGQAVHLLQCELWVYWAPTPNAKGVEEKMISWFKASVGQLPFANRRG